MWAGPGQAGGWKKQKQGIGVGHKVTRGWWLIAIEGGTWGSQRLV